MVSVSETVDKSHGLYMVEKEGEGQVWGKDNNTILGECGAGALYSVSTMDREMVDCHFPPPIRILAQRKLYAPVVERQQSQP